MEEIYKGIKISYIEFRSYFEFEINNITLMTSTLDYAKKTIDNYFRSKMFIGKKVIGFRVDDGTKIIAEIAKLSFENPGRVHTSTITINYINNENIKLPTIGPFMEYNKENEDIADQITNERLMIINANKRIDKLHSIVNSRRII